MTAVLLIALMAADPWAAEVVDHDPPAELSADVRAVLDGKAIEVKEGGEAVLTVWFRNVLPVEASADVLANGVGYRELPAGTLVAVAKLHRPFTDYRKQRIAVGVYTLRFAVQPEVGDHAGTSPHPEFLLLTPAADDEGVAAVEPRELLTRSRKATGGDHPSMMLLVPVGGVGRGVKVVERSGGLRVLTIQRPAASEGTKVVLNVGLVVSGSSPSR